MMSIWEKLPLGRILTTLICLYMLVVIVRAVVAPSATLPRPDDVITAARAVESTAGVDERFPSPSGAWVSGNGVVEPADRETKVAASVSGRVAEVVVREGDAVHVGDPLVRLESSVEKATLAGATADLATAEAELQRLRAGSRSQEIAAARHERDGAQARAAASEDVSTRQAQLAEQGQTSADVAVAARLQAQADRAAVAQAQARLELLEAGSRAEDVAAAEARVEAARARRDEAAARLDQRVVASPIDGVVLQVLVRAGELVGAEPILIVGDLRTLRVRMDLDERDIPKVHAGADAIVRAIAFPGQDFSASVTEVGRRMGRKNIRTDDPVERNDTKILEIVLTLQPGSPLVVGQRVTVYVGAEVAP